jgi:hypothetical protein
MHASEKPEDLNTPALELFGVVFKNNKSVVAGRHPWVDVRDIVEAHVVASEKLGVSGERNLFSAGNLPSLPYIVGNSTPHLTGNTGPVTS